MFPCCLDHFLPDLHLTPHGIICKEGEIDLLVFDRSFLDAPFSNCINQFASTTDKIELQRGIAMTSHLVQTCNLLTSHPSKEILIFDDYTSGALRHVKLHPQVATAHVHSIVQTLCVPIGPVFVANVSSHNWEAFS